MGIILTGAVNKGRESVIKGKNDFELKIVYTLTCALPVDYSCVRGSTHWTVVSTMQATASTPTRATR